MARITRRNELRYEDLMMLFLVLQAYLKLTYFDLYLMRGDFAALYNRVQRCPIANRLASRETVDRLCYAVDLACIWYWKEALCLQRSAATSCLLKSHGISAQMVIGAQQMPFKAHAWVEVDGRVVNDKSYVSEVYPVMNRC
jgi:Transglutaminase-like superfamily